MKGNNTFARLFFVNFHGNFEKGSGTTCRNFFGFWKTGLKSANMKGKNTFARFFRQFSRKPGKRQRRYFSDFGNLEKRPNKNVKMKGS